MAASVTTHLLMFCCLYEYSFLFLNFFCFPSLEVGVAFCLSPILATLSFSSVRDQILSALSSVSKYCYHPTLIGTQYCSTYWPFQWVMTELSLPATLPSSSKVSFYDNPLIHPICVEQKSWGLPWYISSLHHYQIIHAPAPLLNFSDTVVFSSYITITAVWRYHLFSPR